MLSLPRSTGPAQEIDAGTLQPDTPNYRGAEAVKIADLSFDGQLFPRVALSDEKVAEYAALMQQGVHFPPIEVTRVDTGELFPTDGWHRAKATQRCGWTEIPARILDGDWESAIEAAVAANAKHGLPLTAADRRKAVKMLLGLPKWARTSDREIARQCGVTHPTVAAVRAEVSEKLSGKSFQMRPKPLETHDQPLSTVTVTGGEQDYGERKSEVEEDTRPPPGTAQARARCVRASRRHGANALGRAASGRRFSGDTDRRMDHGANRRVVAVGSKPEVMAQLGGGAAARSSISAWVKGDVLDSQRASLAKEAIASIRHDGERRKLIEERGGSVVNRERI